MEFEPRRAALALFGLALLGFILYVTVRFVAALTIAVFVYYSTRPVYRWLGLETDRFPRFRSALLRLKNPTERLLGREFRGLPRTRAVATIAFFSIPLISLVSYTIFVVVVGLRDFLEGQEGYEDPGTLGLGEEELFEQGVGIEIAPLLDAYRAGEFDTLISLLSENAAEVADFITGFLLNILIIVIVTYYLLVEGGKIRRAVHRYDGGVFTRYAEAADSELKSVLFGNLLNVIIISVVAIAVYSGYNFAVPEAAEVPAPVLAGALTGLASLIPVVGMKIIYVPLALVPAVTILTTAEPALLVYVAGFLVAALVIVDTVPDLLLRPYLSGETTHVGFLMLAYIFGPVVFGFYGLFLVPIVLVLALTFVDEALPYVLGNEEYEAEPATYPGQKKLKEFAD